MYAKKVKSVKTTKLTLSKAKQQIKKLTADIENLQTTKNSYSVQIEQAGIDNDKLTCELETSFSEMDNKDMTINELDKRISYLTKYSNASDSKIKDLEADVQFYLNRINLYEQIILYITKY